jgi:hypothetical protein
MKKLRVKAKQQIKAIINFDINQIRTDNGVYLFDDIKFDYTSYDIFQILYLKKSNAIISALYFNHNNNIKIVCNAYSEVTKCNKNLECALAKCRKLLKGGE